MKNWQSWKSIFTDFSKPNVSKYLKYLWEKEGKEENTKM